MHAYGCVRVCVCGGGGGEVSAWMCDYLNHAQPRQIWQNFVFKAAMHTASEHVRS